MTRPRSWCVCPSMMTHRTCQAVDGLNAIEVESAATSPVGEDGQPAPARRLIACRAQNSSFEVSPLEVAEFSRMCCRLLARGGSFNSDRADVRRA